MYYLESLVHNLSIIEHKLGYSFKDQSLLTLAFVHRSFINENRSVLEHNERLEFLGDAILNALISDFLYQEMPTKAEGELSLWRSRLVEASSCVYYLQKLQLESFLLLGKGERLNDGRGRDSILADLFEAIIGAIYLDGGLEAACSFFWLHFTSEVKKILNTPSQNFKAQLQDFCQKNYQQIPLYHVIRQSGPEHSKLFEIAALLEQKELGRGEGPSKKEAQQAAAASALAFLQKTTMTL